MSVVPIHVRLYGLREAAHVLGVHKANLLKVAGINECRYPPGRVAATPLFVADAVDALAAKRTAARS